MYKVRSQPTGGIAYYASLAARGETFRSIQSGVKWYLQAILASGTVCYFGAEAGYNDKAAADAALESALGVTV